jgi:hypothetical protein
MTWARGRVQILPNKLVQCLFFDLQRRVRGSELVDVSSSFLREMAMGLWALERGLVESGSRL